MIVDLNHLLFSLPFFFINFFPHCLLHQLSLKSINFSLSISSLLSPSIFLLQFFFISLRDTSTSYDISSLSLSSRFANMERFEKFEEGKEEVVFTLSSEPFGEPEGEREKQKKTKTEMRVENVGGFNWPPAALELTSSYRLLSVGQGPWRRARCSNNGSMKFGQI